MKLPNDIDAVIQQLIDDINNNENIVKVEFFENRDSNSKLMLVNIDYRHYYQIKWTSPSRSFASINASFYQGDLMTKEAPLTELSHREVYHVYDNYGVHDNKWLPVFMAIEDRTKQPIWPEWWEQVERAAEHRMKIVGESGE